MKKLLALLLSILLILGLFCGCSNTDDDDEDDDDKKSASSKKDEEEDADNESAEDEDSDKPKKENKKKDEEETKEAKEDVAEEATYERGISTSSGWKSEYLGLRFTPSDAYVMLSEDELKEFMEVGAEATGIDLSDPTINYAIMRVVYEMCAINSNGSNIQIIAEKLALSNMTTKQYVEVVSSQMGSINGIEYDVGDPYEVEICGEEYWAFDAEGTLNGVTMGQHYLCRKVGDRMICIIITDTTGSELADILACFSEY